MLREQEFSLEGWTPTHRVYLKKTDVRVKTPIFPLLIFLSW